MALYFLMLNQQQTMDLEQLRYPVGRFQLPTNITSEHITNWITEIENTPTLVEAAVVGFTDEQLDTPYRPDGWTVRQVVHHLPDSHMNSYIRFKWTLTEDTPTIKAYDETRWAQLEEAKNAPVEMSINMLKALHARWVVVLKNLTEEDLKKEFTHPETGKNISLQTMVALYAWHGRHHLAHITSLKERMGW